MKFKELHLRVDQDLFDKVKDYANSNKLSVNESFNQLLRNSLLFDSLLDSINGVLNLLNQLCKDNGYIKRLLIQTYADLDLEQKNPKDSKTLKQFDKSFNSRGMND